MPQSNCLDFIIHHCDRLPAYSEMVRECAGVIAGSVWALFVHRRGPSDIT
jgi:hypothetical protein